MLNTYFAQPCLKRLRLISWVMLNGTLVSNSFGSKLLMALSLADFPRRLMPPQLSRPWVFHLLPNAPKWHNFLWYSRRYHSTFWYVPRGACTPYCKKAILDENVKLATTVYPPWSGHNFLFTCYMPALPKSRSPRCGKICWSLHTFYYGFRPIVYNYVQDIPGRNHSFAPSYWYLWQYYWLPPHYLLWCQLGTPGHFPSISLKHPTSNHRGVKINLWAPILLQWLSNSVEDT